MLSRRLFSLFYVRLLLHIAATAGSSGIQIKWRCFISLTGQEDSSGVYKNIVGEVTAAVAALVACQQRKKKEKSG